jgi:hypothetical protein
LDIDAVYTWVNHLDPQWQRQYQAACDVVADPASAHETANALARFQNRNELIYSVKSLKKYAPWIRNIYILTNCDLPLEIANEPRLRKVPHESVFPDPDVLPNFNSRAIESNLHRIPGLSEYFIYLNDDFFICRNVEPTDFFSSDGIPYVFPSQHDMPYGKAGPLSPFEHGALNACRLITEETGYKPQKRLHHAPYSLVRSTLEEIETKYRVLLDQTRTHKFRHEDDIPLATSMHAYYSVAHSRGELRDIHCRYIDIGDPLFVFLIQPFSPLRRGRYTTCCINEVTDMKFFPGLRDKIVQRFMQSMFA